MPTIHDVAKRAKVSIASVSLVMNDASTPRVGEVKRKAILKAADVLGYSPNRIAKALIHGQSKILGLLVPMRDPIFFNHFIAQFLSGIQAAILQEGYHLMIYSHQGETGRITAAELKQSRFADGLIVLNTRMCTAEDQESTIQELRGAKIPFVMANAYSGKELISYVGLDDFGAGKLGAEHLIGKGHRHIALINGAKGSPLSRSLLQGVEKAHRDAKLKISKSLNVYSEYDPRKIREAMSAWLHTKPRPTAIFCGDDQFVPEVYSVLEEHGLKIPDDMAVLGRGDTSLASAVVPKLSTVSVPGYRLGVEAAQLLIERLRNAKAKPRRMTLACSLVTRAST